MSFIGLAIATLSVLQAGTPDLFPAAPVRIESKTECPTAEAIHRSMNLLLPPASATPLGHRATVDRLERTLRIRLHGDDGRLLAERQLPQTESCSDLAEAAAVVIVTWKAGFDPGAIPSPGPMASASQESREPQPGGLDLEVGTGVVGVVSSDGQTMGVTVLADFARQKALLGLHLALVVPGLRERRLGDGSARWWRPTVAAGPRLRASYSRFVVHVWGGLAAGWLSVRGSGFSLVHHHHGFVPAVAAGLRVGFQARAVSFFAGVDGLLTLGRNQLVAFDNSGARAASSLSGTDLLLIAGLLWRLPP